MHDVHTHMIKPEHWGPEFDRNWRAAYGGKDWPEPQAATFDAAMREAGIDFAVLFGITARAAGVHTPSEAVAVFMEALETPSVGFMALDPNDEDWADQIDKGLKLGMKGIKLYPVMALFDARDAKFEPFFKAAQDNDLAVLWHMGATPCAEGDLAISHPLVVDSVARRFPDLRQIIAHMGHPWQRDSVQVLRKNRKVYADISGMWTRQMDGYLAMVNAQEWNVVDKLLFGSDFPLWTPQETVNGLWKLTEMGGNGFPKVTAETIETILKHDIKTTLSL